MTTLPCLSILTALPVAGAVILLAAGTGTVMVYHGRSQPAAPASASSVPKTSWHFAGYADPPNPPSNPPSGR